MQNKKGQVTIFIILVIMVVAAILVYFIVIKPQTTTPEGVRLGFEGCMSEAVQQELAVIGKQAGYIQPDFFYTYQNDKIGYLCYTNLYYTQCTNYKPFLTTHVENELKKASLTAIINCYDSSLDNLRSQGYEVVPGGALDLNISIVPGKIDIVLNAPVTVSRETGRQFTTFNSELQVPLYDMLMVATSIVQQETRYGDSDVTTLMIYYPEYAIDKLKQGDGTTLYIMEHLKTKTKFQFATRSLVYPPGYGMKSGLLPDKPAQP